MPSHRKPRTRIGTTAPALGVTTAALASVSLLAQSADAAPAGPKPSIEEVQKKVDDLYRQADLATQKYDAAKEATAAQRAKADALLDQVAAGTAKLNDTRRVIGSYAAAQYRDGGVTPTMTLLFSDDPQAFFDRNQLMGRLSDEQHRTLSTFESQRAANAKKRAEASRSLAALTTSQQTLRAGKQDVQTKLAAARTLLSTLTAQEKARLAAIEKKKQDEAERQAAELAAQQAAAAAKKKATPPAGHAPSSPSSPSAPSAPATTKAAKALAFARAQMGKPYVWGATGPASYDCSGLTQAAWKAAGVDLPRTTWDQVKTGTRVATADLQPGDLVFFYDDISHVGMYIGNGMMIHAPHSGAYVREESIYYMPIYGSVRPA
ncbi:C40 family peptidase [Streptomyces violascens]|uniref:Glycoside hydrolase n=1 Tax=Streptomyces violascens TaxID=67381 RepID=A0ABQ3R197_9ACTN|nr:C40 family peptidase [Streptomyces violascens]GGU10492.1 glycoside hydrolase [Streptomyces violascens]GHI43285.1 glycoside hydrolase [Streptomyces violascens]